MAIADEPEAAGPPGQSSARHPAMDLLTELRRFGVETHAYIFQVARRLRLNPTDVSALGVLLHDEQLHQPMSAGRLGRALGLTPAAMSALMTRMEARNLLGRTRSGRDRRSIVTEATEHAALESSDAFEPLNSCMADVLRRYDSRDIAIATASLRDLRTAAGDARGLLDQLAADRAIPTVVIVTATPDNPAPLVEANLAEPAELLVVETPPVGPHTDLPPETLIAHETVQPLDTLAGTAETPLT